MPNKNLLLILIIISASLVNLLGAFGPELSFDALWYHLPIAKTYLNSGKITHIPGGLLYYSAMPRLAELMFIPLIKLFGDLGPHLLNFAAGIGTSILIYIISRKYLGKTYSLLAVLIFYATPLVGWQSGSGYIDLIRTFWETLALLLVLNKRYTLSALVAGLAISTKTLSLGSLPILAMIVWVSSKNLTYALRYMLYAILVCLPWFLLSFLNTGHPFYPIGAGILDVRHSSWSQILHPLSIFADYWNLFLNPEDLISPIFVIIVPFMMIKFKTLISKHPLLVVYWLLSYFVWWLTPRTGGGRFLLPYLPVWSILAVAVISLQNVFFKKLLISCVILVAAFNIVYRLGAQYKLLNYFLGSETKKQYLCRNLNFNFGDFYDCDDFFSKNIKPTDLVLIKGVHNLNYVEFPFVHESWYRGEKINYILVQGNNKQNGEVGKLIYSNNLTKVRLYKIN